MQDLLCVLYIFLYPIFTTWRNYSWLDRQMKAECAMRDNKHNYIARLKGHNKGVNMQRDRTQIKEFLYWLYTLWL
ncbi:hypothetical protein CQA53_10435 [Helicobacter didelphidarum]|uniref:Uncharacterized protein n=1 Tax=Helicobacter didelphidarum TaxID=2040648 RepID=A0A3D8I9P5_9HELI|nr:hypothetical protein CQA53_10435 [Helicobacter didelphidarum]